MDQLKSLIEDSGFEGIGEFDPQFLKVKQEVRDMCSVNVCHEYNTSWTCPPALGELDYFQELFGTYTGGYVFQTVAQMEDDFDFEAIQAASELHASRFDELLQKTEGQRDGIYLFTAGRCKLCETCTYPDHPCVHPDKAFPSLEACGLVVAEVCDLAQVPYYHGPHTIAFIGGALWR